LKQKIVLHNRPVYKFSLYHIKKDTRYNASYGKDCRLYRQWHEIHKQKPWAKCWNFRCVHKMAKRDC